MPGRAPLDSMGVTQTWQRTGNRGSSHWQGVWGRQTAKGCCRRQPQEEPGLAGSGYPGATAPTCPCFPSSPRLWPVYSVLPGEAPKHLAESLTPGRSSLREGGSYRAFLAGLPYVRPSPCRGGVGALVPAEPVLQLQPGSPRLLTQPSPGPPHLSVHLFPKLDLRLFGEVAPGEADPGLQASPFPVHQASPSAGHQASLPHLRSRGVENYS